MYPSPPAATRTPNCQATAVELLVPIDKFDSAADINRVLGKVFQALARNAIPARNAAILAYICQLLLNTLPALEQQKVNAEMVPNLKRILVRVLKAPLAEAAAQCAAPPPKAYWEDPMRYDARNLRVPVLPKDQAAAGIILIE